MRKYFETSSGSRYEYTDTHIRKADSGRPTERIGDGWRRFSQLILEIGEPAVIVWPREDYPEVDASRIPTTITSSVVSTSVELDN